jgi:hypothetical protein
MAKDGKRELVRAAAKARQRAVAPYSFKVGTALLPGPAKSSPAPTSKAATAACCAGVLFNALTSGGIS